MKGTIRRRGDLVFVEYVDRHFTEPRETVLLWCVDRICREAYGRGRDPMDGDEVVDLGLSAHGAAWRGDGYSVHFPGDRVAEERLERDVPPPRVRAGVEVRWRSGQWEKYLKSRGWVPA